uniref:MIF4G-like type 2 domain-containing protein n=1 Tax=Anopheles farauti TaxID=69004 RepID=A0A182Q9S1_9DIPT
MLVVMMVMMEWVLLGLQWWQEGIDGRVQVDGIRDGLHDTHRDGLQTIRLVGMQLLLPLLSLLLSLLLWRCSEQMTLSSGSYGRDQLDVHGNGDRLGWGHLDHMMVGHDRNVVNHHLALRVVEGDGLDEMRWGWEEARRSGHLRMNVRMWNQNGLQLLGWWYLRSVDGMRCRMLCWILPLRWELLGLGQRVLRRCHRKLRSGSTGRCRRYLLVELLLMMLVVVVMVKLGCFTARQQRLHEILTQGDRLLGLLLWRRSVEASGRCEWGKLMRTTLRLEQIEEGTIERLIILAVHRNSVRRDGVDWREVLGIILIPDDVRPVVRRFDLPLLLMSFLRLISFLRGCVGCDGNLQLEAMSTLLVTVSNAFHFPPSAHVAVMRSCFLRVVPLLAILLDEEVRIVALALESSVGQLDNVTEPGNGQIDHSEGILWAHYPPYILALLAIDGVVKLLVVSFTCCALLIDPRSIRSMVYYEQASLPGTATAHKLVVAIRQKCNAEDVLNELNDLPNSRDASDTDMAEAPFNPLKIDALAETEEAQICILHNMFELWVDHQQMMVVIVDKLLKVQIVECSAVATWVFSKEMVGEFTKMYLWEILHLTIKKMNQHVTKLSREMNEAKDKLARTVESSSSESEEEEGGEPNPQKRRKNTETSGEKPTEEQVERMEEKLEAAYVDQKRLFLIIFQRFIMILSEHLVKCDTDGRDYDTDWYRWTIGRLQQVFMMHHEQVQKYSSTLESLLFTSDLDPHILDVFHQFTALRACDL